MVEMEHDITNLKDSFDHQVMDLSSNIEDKSKYNKVMNLSLMNMVSSTYSNMQREIDQLTNGFQEVILLFTNLIPPNYH